MKRMLAKGTVVLVVSLFTLGAAQETTPQSSDGMTMGQGNMGQNNMGQNNMEQGMMGEQQGMMAMMQMMQACSSMMQAVQGEQMGMMGGQMDTNQMDTNQMDMNMAATSSRIDEAAAEALARAFLTGRDSEAAVTLQNVLSTEGGYTVQYLQGDTPGTLSVDATTGEVQPQTSE